jgi:hypothetical protein
MYRRSFKEQATKLVQVSQIRSIADPRFASHATREAGKYLPIIDRLKKQWKLNKHTNIFGKSEHNINIILNVL